MTKKKRGHPDLEEVLGRPWCYYCERDFDDLKILINHQKAKHFKCDRCGRRLNTAGGLNVHMSQVHKEALSAVDNALPNRAGLDIEIFGMEGIPEDIAQQHNQRVIAAFHQNLVDKQASASQGGTPAPGTTSQGQSKKPKFESPSDLKKRLAEHKAKKAEQQAGGSSGGGTPLGAGQGQSPGGFNSPQYGQQQSYPPPNASPSYPTQIPPYNTAPGAPQYAQQPFNGATAPPFPYSQASPGVPTFPPNGYPPQPSFSPPPAAYAAHPAPSHNGQHLPFGQYPPPLIPSGQQPPYGTQTPPPFFQNQQGQLMQTPSHNGGLPTRPGSLPPAPGLPQRPSFEAPHVNAFQMQQMHQGQIPGSSNPPASQPTSGNEPSSLDELISGASKQANEAAKVQKSPLSTEPTASIPSVSGIPNPETAATPGTEPPKKSAEEQGEEKASKKDKEKSKATRLVYTDNDVSPEEKMANLSRYAFALQKVGA